MLDLIIAGALVQSALFNPPIDRPLTQITEQVHADAAGERRYRVERTLRFSRDADGLFADLTLIRTDGQADDQRFERGLAGLKGRTIRYRLDAQGRLTTIPGMEGHWAAFSAGLAESAAPAAGMRIISALRGAPPAQQRAMLWSMVEPLILADIAAQSPYRLRPVSQPGRPPFATGAVLSGTESLSHSADGSAELRRIVRGSHRAPIDRTGGTEAVERERETRITLDSATGLLERSVEVTRTRIGTAEHVVTTTLSVSENVTGN